MRTGVTGLTLLVKSHIHNDFADTIVEFNGSSTFFLDVFNMQPADVCSRFQQWVCNQKSSKLCVLPIFFNTEHSFQVLEPPTTFRPFKPNAPC
jgi:hypothetical protein